MPKPPPNSTFFFTRGDELWFSPYAHDKTPDARRSHDEDFPWLVSASGMFPERKRLVAAAAMMEWGAEIDRIVEPAAFTEEASEHHSECYFQIEAWEEWAKATSAEEYGALFTPPPFPGADDAETAAE